MARALLFFEKCRLVRLIPKLTRDLVKFEHKIENIKKNITSVQKQYASIYQQLESKEALEIKQVQMTNQSAAYCTNTLTSLAGSIFDFAKKQGTLTDTAGQKIDTDNLTLEQFQNVNQGMYNSFISQAQQQSQSWLQQTNLVYEQQIKANYENLKKQYEYQEEAALDPLNYEETMLEIDKEATEDQLATAKAYKESVDQASSEENRNVPKFGLG